MIHLHNLYTTSIFSRYKRCRTWKQTWGRSWKTNKSATAENCGTAWDLLQERYNNLRVLVTTLIQQILDQPNAGPSTAAI